MKDKGTRQRIAKQKHHKRCNVLGLEPERHYELKAQAKPCSCYACKSDRYSRKKKHKQDEI